MPNEITGEVLYQFFILKILIQHGGRAETYRITDTIWRDYKHILSEKDISDYEKSKEPRWKNHIRFARQHLIEVGCLKRGSPRGIWEITEEGKLKYHEWVKSIKENLSLGENKCQ